MSSFFIRKLVLLLLLMIAFPWSGKTCTIVVVSGRVTEDGRPLLLKNRDSNSSMLELTQAKGLIIPIFAYLLSTMAGHYVDIMMLVFQ